ncbi:hypothetical protein ACP70R_019168 [Stipagrostis hirtigluma subsp. patula]
MDSDDNMSIFSDDHIDDDEFDITSNGGSKNDSCDDAVVNEAIFELFKKHKIKILKRKLGSSFVADLINLKANKVNKVKSDFSRLSRKSFTDVLSGLAIDQTGVIERFGFGSLLKFDKCTVPKDFVKWISSCIDVRTSELILKGRVIHFSKLSVHKILGLPIGGAALLRDSVAGKDFLLSRFNVEKIDSMDLFVDKLLGAHDLSDDEVFTCFMVVAISCFLCPDSSYQHLTDLIHVFQDVTRVKNFDWSLMLYELVLAYVAKMLRQKFVSSNGVHVMNACSYFLTVFYLDCVNLGSYYISTEIPRISVWKGAVLKLCLELDEIKPGKYGRRPLKVLFDTSYSEISFNFDEVGGHGLALQSAICDFNSKLESLYGAILPDELKLGISKIFGTHCVEEAKRGQYSCEQLIFKIFTFCNQISDKFKEAQSIGEDSLVHVDVATHCAVQNAEEDMKCGLENLVDHLDVIPSTKSVCSHDGVLGESDLALKIGYSCQKGGASVVSNGMKMNDNHDQSGMEVKCSIFDKEQNVVPNPVLALDTPCLLNVRNNISSGPTPFIAGTPVVQPKINIKDKGKFSKLSMLDLNENASVIATQNLCTPVDKVIDVDSNLPIPQLSERNCSNVANFGFDKDIPKNSKLVCKERFVSKSANFLSKLQIGDLNVPLVETEDLSPMGGYHVKHSNSVSTHQLQHSISKDMHTDIHSGHKRSDFEACGVAPVSIISVPDKNGGDKFVVNEKQPIGLINLDDELDNHDNDDVQFIREVNFQSKCRDLCNQCDITYDQNIVRASKSVNAEFQEPSVCKAQSWSSMFVLSKQEKLNYIATCRLATNSKMKDQNAVDIGKCYVKYSELGNSLRTGCKVGSFVINALCRKLFLDKRPTISKKHYFFSGVGASVLIITSFQAILLNGHGSISYVQKCFDGAASVLPLHKADMLLFPICYNEHWFLFIVDMKNQLFVILDSYYSEVDGYQIYVRSQLIPNFKKIWSELVIAPLDFENFDIVYPPVPKQNNFCRTDCEDIDNIRIHTVSSLLCSEHNIVDISPVTNYFQQGSFPQFGQIRKGTSNNGFLLQWFCLGNFMFYLVFLELELVGDGDCCKLGCYAHGCDNAGRCI